MLKSFRSAVVSRIAAIAATCSAVMPPRIWASGASFSRTAAEPPGAVSPSNACYRDSSAGAIVTSVAVHSSSSSWRKSRPRLRVSSRLVALPHPGHGVSPACAVGRAPADGDGWCGPAWAYAPRRASIRASIPTSIAAWLESISARFETVG